MIVVFRHLFLKDYVGLSFWPFIFIRDSFHRDDAVLINHERIHLRQQAELLVLPFYLLYITEWLLRCVYYRNPYKAYKNISFEREAYYFENDPHYLANRTPYSFLRYL